MSPRNETSKEEFFEKAKGIGGIGAIPPSFLVSDILQLNQQQQQPGLRQVSLMLDLLRAGLNLGGIF